MLDADRLLLGPSMAPQLIHDLLDLDARPVRKRRPAAAGPLAFAALAGSSIAAPDAAPWVSDFLSAAYYRRPLPEREVDDLRLAFAILQPYWYRTDPARRLRLADLPAFHRAFGRDRFERARSPRGTLGRHQLLARAVRLLGEWFGEAYADDDRRAWGIAFPTTSERDAYEPSHRLALARLGALTPERAPLERQGWHTYPPVAIAGAGAVVDALTHAECWPDYATEIGRFTPLRPGGLRGQTFEIEVAAGTASGRPLFARGYVTVTTLVTPDDPHALRAYFRAVEAGMARYGHDEPDILPYGAMPLAGLDL